jgi:hypothetical protein
MPWTIIERLILNLSTQPRISIFGASHWFRISGAFGRAWGINRIRYRFKRDKGIDLLPLLSRTCGQDCSDPRDKVYSILAITHRELREQLQPDYNKSLAHVFTAAIVADMRVAGDLEALHLVDHGPLLLNEFLPSWVGDLRTVARGSLLSPKNPMPNPHFTFSQDFRILNARGFAFDMIIETNIQETSMPFKRLLPLKPVKWTWDLRRIINRFVEEGRVRTQEMTMLNARKSLHRSVERTLYAVMIADHLNENEAAR